MTEQVEYESIDLEKFRLIALTYLTDELMEEFATPPVLDVSATAAGCMMDMLTVRIKQEVYGETLGTLEVKHPATWFQMLKEQYAPYWFKRRWPVRYAYQKYDARALYPKLALPDEVHNRTWITKRWREGYEPEGS